MQKHFLPILHHLSPVILGNATELAFVLLNSSRFSFHCYTQHEAMLTQKLAQKWLLRPFATSCMKITKGICLCKPALLNCPMRLVFTSLIPFICSWVQHTYKSSILGFRTLIMDNNWSYCLHVHRPLIMDTNWSYCLHMHRPLIMDNNWSYCMHVHRPLIMDNNWSYCIHVHRPLIMDNKW